MASFLGVFMWGARSIHVELKQQLQYQHLQQSIFTAYSSIHTSQLKPTLKSFIVVPHYIMGNLSINQHLVTNKELIDKLNFFLEEQVPSLRQITVLRLNQRPFDFYMRYREICIDNSATLASVQTKKRVYQGLQGLRSIVKIEATQISKAMEMCSRTIKFDSYARYHNYTLQLAINNKIQSKKQFTEADLLFVLGTLLGIGHKITSVLGKGYRGIFKAESIFLSIDGYIKVYPFQIFNINQASQPYEETSQSVSSEMGQKVTSNMGYRGPREDISDIAVLLLELATLNRQEYNWQEHWQQLQFKLKRQMCPRVRHLVFTMLLNGHQLNYQGLLGQLDDIKNSQRLRASLSLRLQQDISARSSQMLQMKESLIVHEQQARLKRLESIGNNLTAARIDIVGNRKRQ